jgi:CheY-like chemotaxis protein
MRSSPSILIAEDHSDSREALRALLEACGYSVEIASDGREAVARAVETRPDLILMDIMMPEVDGLEATRQLRARGEFRGVPILALTAMQGAREKALAAGCDDCVNKPLDLPRFLAKLQRWLEGERTGR